MLNTGNEDNMKICNVRFIAIAYYSDGSISKARLFVGEKAMSNWANRQYNKDNGVTVKVWNAHDDSLYCTYHA